jgi:hypothetical protein
VGPPSVRRSEPSARQSPLEGLRRKPSLRRSHASDEGELCVLT